ncbi:MAG: hypothetical protein C0407_14835 [Desulfobacca sp.]|nr:hypothetical protein [Desulfobacca sp.]
MIIGVIFFLLSGFLACNSTFSGGGSQKDVQYTVNGLQISHNADNERDYTIVGVGTDYKVLTWYCGNYNGFIKRYVELTFKKQNSWILDNQEMRSGNCS